MLKLKGSGIHIVVSYVLTPSFCRPVLMAGMELAQISLIVGVDSAKLLNKILERINHNRGRKGLKKLQAPAPDNLRRRYWSLMIFVLLGGFLWLGSLILTVFDSSSSSRRTLWLACLVAPPGVWMRWYFARLNGQGIGSKHYLRWLPFGTLLVNVSASTIEAALATVEVAVSSNVSSFSFLRRPSSCYLSVLSSVFGCSAAVFFSAMFFEDSSPFF